MIDPQSGLPVGSQPVPLSPYWAWLQAAAREVYEESSALMLVGEAASS